MVGMCGDTGTGGFGRVKLVRHKPTGTHLALKMLNKSEIVKHKQINHVCSERAILMELDHPYIIRLCAPRPPRASLHVVRRHLAPPSVPRGVEENAKRQSEGDSRGGVAPQARDVPGPALRVHAAGLCSGRRLVLTPARETALLACHGEALRGMHRAGAGLRAQQRSGV